ncbi:MAG: ATP-dependent DNA helicase RecG [Alphaproteobacteria bacterium]|nr:ATP-dependent DNA helicase RecG [Alphaproteobacteria bacterium]
MRPEILYPLFADISSLKGIGTKTVKLLQNLLGSTKLIDLAFHLPSNLVDRSYCPKLVDAISGRICTIKAKVVEHIAPKSKHQPYKVIMSDGTDNISLIFFKIYADSIAKNLPIGSTRIVSGKLDSFNGNLQMSHPDYIVDENDINKLPLFEAVYPLTAGISTKMINRYINQALQKVPNLPEWLDNEFLKKQGWNNFRQALTNVHSPRYRSDLEPFSKDRARLAYDELLANQLALAIVRERVKKQKGRIIKGNGMLRKKIMEKLSFELTKAQKNVLAEIYTDQAEPFRMLRLLQGDVGSGKTIVALLAMLNAVESGVQAAIMAPTEILAKQHYETIAPLCEDIGIKAELLIGKTKGKTRNNILQDLENGKINIIIGTHALFQEDVKYKDLGFVVVDEQHRFGVHQRLSLSNKGDKADVLIMTATPIPRTLVLTSYGDMEYSKIDQMPEGRKPVDTRVLPVSKLGETIAALKRKLEEGTRAYWVCPLVEESEKIDLAAAEARYTDLQNFFGDKVGLVHGKMKEKDKDIVMERFKKGEINLLVATTVIEVGVNVPEATVMVIEHAERFGLAQLHQLRGRVKRGINPATCLLLYSMPLSEIAQERLNIMKQTEDGFLIAEKDLELRGGGEILGTRQSGFCSFRLADMDYHKNLLVIANQDAKLILNKDPNLQSERGQALRTLLYLFEKDDSIKNYRG